MSLFPRFILSIVVAIVISGVYLSLSRNGAPGFIFDFATAVAFAITAATAVAITFYLPSPNSDATATTPHSAKSKPATGRQSGSVKWFNGSKGFGFITCDSGEEIFVHFRSVEKDSRRLSPGKRVEFVVVEGKKGQEAEQVRVV